MARSASCKTYPADSQPNHPSAHNFGRCVRQQHLASCSSFRALRQSLLQTGWHMLPACYLQTPQTCCCCHEISAAASQVLCKSVGGDCESISIVKFVSPSSFHIGLQYEPACRFVFLSLSVSSIICRRQHFLHQQMHSIAWRWQASLLLEGAPSAAAASGFLLKI